MWINFHCSAICTLNYSIIARIYGPWKSVSIRWRRNLVKLYERGQCSVEEHSNCWCMKLSARLGWHRGWFNNRLLPFWPDGVKTDSQLSKTFLAATVTVLLFNYSVANHRMANRKPRKQDLPLQTSRTLYSICDSNCFPWKDITPRSNYFSLTSAC